MQPDGSKNYWQPEPNEAARQPAEQPVPDDSVNTPQADFQTDPDDEATPRPATDVGEPIYWIAPEYIKLEKSALWFVVFAIVVVGLIAVDVFFLKSWTFSALVVVMAVAVVIFARRPPRDLKYTLSPTQGLYINDHLYRFDEFKAFGLIKDGEHDSVMLIPIKRFALGLTVYFPQEVGEQLVDILGSRLPMKELKLDAIDIIVRKLHL